jgi:glutamyl-tRNA synthetase
MSSSPVRVRFAPSPTGPFHIGGARTALYNYLLARQTGGQFIIRIEDTDQKRLVHGAEEEMMEALAWLGMTWDEGPDISGPMAPYRQSERVDIYHQHAEQLVQADKAYHCFCTPERLAQVRKLQQKRKQPPRYDGLCRKLSREQAQERVAAGESYVIRFKTPVVGETTGLDVLRGEITVKNESIDDYILMKSDGLPVYHLAAMVDDHLMEVSHVLRSSEWLPTFPLHVLIYEAFGWKQPEWLHLSVFLNPSGKGKMSKRHQNGSAIYALEFRERGYLPEAVINWLALMGWSYDDHTEYFQLEDLVEMFSIEKLNPSPAAVNFSKLEHFNGLHIRSLSTAELNDRLLPYFRKAGLQADAADLEPIVPLIQERIRTLDEAVSMAGFFFRETVEPAPDELVGKQLSAAESATAARQAQAVIEAYETLDIELLEADLRSLAEALDLKVGQLFGILRVAVTGQRVSPPLIETMQILGRELVLARLSSAISLLDSQS